MEKGRMYEFGFGVEGVEVCTRVFYDLAFYKLGAS